MNRQNPVLVIVCFIAVPAIAITAVADQSETADNSKRTYLSGLRYIQSGPSKEQINPLSVTVNIKFSKHIATVGDAIRYIIARSGYHISHQNRLEKGTRLLFSLPLPQIQRRLEPMSLRQALAVLIGNAYRIEVNPISRAISFKIKPDYKKMLSAAIADYYYRKNDAPVDKSLRYANLATIRHSKLAAGPPAWRSKKIADRSSVQIRASTAMNVEYAIPVRSFALKNKPAFATANQAVVAVFEKNRRKFYADNMYSLKAGEKLLLPDSTYYKRYSPVEADYIVLDHFHEWRKLLSRSRRRGGLPVMAEINRRPGKVITSK